MSKKNLLSIILIIIAVVAYYYYQGDNNEMVIATPDNIAELPVYQSNKMLTIIYDMEGKPLYYINAVTVKHFDESGNTEFDLPDITLFDKTHQPSWFIKSKRATLTKENLLYLYTDVQLNNLSHDAQIKVITTDNAKVDLNTQLVTSDDPVMMKGDSFYSTGVGLLGDLKVKTAHILDNVKTYYNGNINSQ